MKIAVLNAIDSGHVVPDVLKKELDNTGAEYTWFEMENMNIMPCRSCGSCGDRTPGRCVQDDDMQVVFKTVAGCDLIIMLTAVTFGGYSSRLKKAVDRFMAMGVALYMVKDGHLLHPMRYGKKHLLGIGLTDGNHRDEDENFKLLVSRNAMNMQYSYRTLLFSPSDTRETIEPDITAALAGGK